MKWNCYARVVGSAYLGEVEAATKEEAEQKAWEINKYLGLCHQCSDKCEDPEIESITVEEA